MFCIVWQPEKWSRVLGWSLSAGGCVLLGHHTSQLLVMASVLLVRQLDHRSEGCFAAPAADAEVLLLVAASAVTTLLLVC
jgi:hypothetical protein